MSGDDDTVPACAGDRGPGPEDDDLSSLQEVTGPWEAVSGGKVMVAVDSADDDDSDEPWAHGQTAPHPAVSGGAIPWTGTPLQVELQAADDPPEDATEAVDVAPQELQLTPDSIGQDYGIVHIVNQSAEEQTVIVSAQLPETIALYVLQDEPHSATLFVTMDATHELASDADDENKPAVHISTASGITTVPVTQSPAPYSGASAQSGD